MCNLFLFLKMQSCSVYLLVLILCCFGLEATIAHPQSTLRTLTVEQKWEKMEESVKSMIDRGIKLALPMVIDSARDINISSTCMSDGIRLFAAARQLRPWAMKIIGANSNAITAIAFDTLASIGAYDQCVHTQLRHDRGKKKGELIMRGKYCVVEVRPPLPPMSQSFDVFPPELKNFSRRDTFFATAAKFANRFHELPYRVGLCVPSGCSKRDIDQLAGKVAESSFLSLRMDTCEVKRENEFHPLIIIILTIYSFILFLSVAATLTANYCKDDSKNNGLHMKMLLSFSFQKNWKQLFNFYTPKKELLCLDGIRGFTMLWVILTHTYVFSHAEATRGLSIFVEYFSSPFLPVVYRGSLAVITFFFLSGLLSCYNCMALAKSLNTTFRIGLLILHRFLRLFPPMLLVLSFTFLVKLIGSGPLWIYGLEKYTAGCYANWWRNAFFITNFHFSSTDSCLGYTWYVSCDLQLYIFTLLLIIPLMRRMKWGVTLSVGCIVASMVATAAITVLNDHPPEFIISAETRSEEQTEKFLSQIHVMPHVHLASYVIGILTGYFLYLYPKIRMPKHVVTLGWSVFLVVSALVYIGMIRWNLGLRPTLLDTVFYSSCIRAAWAVAISWLVIACVNGYGGFINQLLSMKIWIPIRRLTYSAYLVHVLVIIIFYGVMRTERSMYHATYIWEFFGHTVASYGIAILVFLTVESPFSNIQKLLLRRNMGPPPVKENNGCLTEEMEKGPPEGDPSPLPEKESLKPGGLDNPIFVQKL